MKKFTSILLILALLTSMFALSVSAVPPETEHEHEHSEVIHVCKYAAQPASINGDPCPYCGNLSVYPTCGGDTAGLAYGSHYQLGYGNCNVTYNKASTVTACNSCHRFIAVTGTHNCYESHECPRGFYNICPIK